MADTEIDGALSVRALDDLSTEIVELSPSAFKWDDPNHDPGQFTLELQNDLVPGGLDVDKAIVVKLNGQPAFTVVVNKSDAIELAEEQDETTTYTGSMLRSILDRGRVLPPRGYEQQPFGDSRTFSFASPEYDVSAWSAATAIVALQSDLSAFYGGLPKNWFDPEASWIGCSVDTDDTGHIGVWYTVGDFTLAADTDLVFIMGADNRATLFFDGFNLLDIGTYLGFNETHRVTVRATAGTHRIGAKVENYLDGGSEPPFGMGASASGNPTAFICSVYEIDAAGRIGPLVIHTDTSWSVLEYPDPPPGMTVKQALRIMLDENQAEGLLPDVTIDGADDTLDSNGNALDTYEFLTLDIGRALLDVLNEWSMTYCDWDMPGPVDQTLKLWRWAERGVASGVVYEQTDDPDTSGLDGLKRSRLALIADALMVRWAGGWFREPASGGSKLGFAKFGNAPSIDEARRVAAQYIALNGVVREMLTADIAPVNDGDVPYLDYAHGDTITTGVDVERVSRITGEFTDNGVVLSTFTNELIKDVEDRLTLAIQRLSNGTLGGTSPATPAGTPPKFGSTISSTELSFSAPDPIPVEVSTKTDAVTSSGNLFGVLAILNTASSAGTTDFTYMVDGVDVLNGAGSLGVGVEQAFFHVDLGSSQFTQWLEGLVSRLSMEVTAVGTDAQGLVVKGVVIE